MGLFTSIIVGLLAGMAASWLMKTNHKWFIDVLIGIAGSILAGWITSLVLGTNLVSGFNLTTLLVSTGGAVLVLLIYNWFTYQKKGRQNADFFFIFVAIISSDGEEVNNHTKSQPVWHPGSNVVCIEHAFRQTVIGRSSSSHAFSLPLPWCGTGDVALADFEQPF